MCTFCRPPTRPRGRGTAELTREFGRSGRLRRGEAGGERLERHALGGKLAEGETERHLFELAQRCERLMDEVEGCPARRPFGTERQACRRRGFGTQKSYSSR